MHRYPPLLPRGHDFEISALILPHGSRKEAAPTPNLTHPEYPIAQEAALSLGCKGFVARQDSTERASALSARLVRHRTNLVLLSSLTFSLLAHREFNDAEEPLFVRKRIPPTYTVLSCSRLDLSYYPCTPKSRHLRLVMCGS
ncbi:hypothetical protein J6590_090686 [Homalodisca vitripennis]|nr:hypothetical protein J6590_090686 [Homalodisca vitripennis]